MDILDKYLNSEEEKSYRPEFFRLQDINDKQRLEALLKTDNSFFVYDEMEGQLRELVKCLNPHLRIKNEDYPDLVEKHLNGCKIQEYGIWVYYPWSNKIVHCLDEEEFIEVRTNRNKYKLTKEEQRYLSGKKIGIIGLSVGQSIALTIAMERICGELRLADFDTAELSNLNRIRTGLHNLGVRKTIIAAREIAEIDPFIKVKIFNDGLTQDNIDEFFTGDTKLDLLVEVCDGLDIKIQSRFKARELRIPVVMDTNDRGMMDIERFDLEPDRPILHGLAGDLNPDNIKDLSNEQKIPYIFKMVGIDTLSTRLKASMIEVGQSINTWPQLASSVVLGGALTTDVSRRILLDQYHASGRYYIDPEELISDEKHAPGGVSVKQNDLNDVEKERIVQGYLSVNTPGHDHELSESDLDQILNAAKKAPAYNNDHFWVSYYAHRRLFIFDSCNKNNWDEIGLGAYMSIGAAIENIQLQAAALGLAVNVSYLPLNDENKLVAVISFSVAQIADNEALLLSKNIKERRTQRELVVTSPLPLDFFEKLEYFVKAEPDVKLYYAHSTEDIRAIASVVGACHRLQILDENGHSDLYENIKWGGNKDVTAGGIDISEMGFSDGEKAGYSVAREWKAVKLLSQWDKGNVFELMATHRAGGASGMLLISIGKSDKVTLMNAGKLMERVWLYATSQGIAVQPLIAPAIVFNKLNTVNTLKDKEEKRIRALKDDLIKIFSLEKGYERDTQVFLIKLALPANAGV